jgi:hypothetical protein
LESDPSTRWQVNESYHFGVLIAGIERKLYLKVVTLSTVDVHTMVPTVGYILDAVGMMNPIIDANEDTE